MVEGGLYDIKYYSKKKKKKITQTSSLFIYPPKIKKYVKPKNEKNLIEIRYLCVCLRECRTNKGEGGETRRRHSRNAIEHRRNFFFFISFFLFFVCGSSILHRNRCRKKPKKKFCLSSFDFFFFPSHSMAFHVDGDRGLLFVPFP